MSTHTVVRRNRPVATGRVVLMALALIVAAPVPAALAQAVAATGTPVFTVIVTRHGVRAIPRPDDAKDPPPPFYAWPKWEVGPNNLTRHGYKLMTLMGKFYRDRQESRHLPVGDCPKDSVFVYADTDQRTLATAHALIEGLCGRGPQALTVYHAETAKPPGNPIDGNARNDGPPKDAIFNATDWVAAKHKLDTAKSKDAVIDAAGGPSFPVLAEHADDFKAFQDLLQSRCKGGICKPIMSEPKPWLDTPPDDLATLKGPLGLAQSYSENIFLEDAQCRDLQAMAPGFNDEQFDAALQAGMRLHVLSYDVNARNGYNPLVRGGTLFAHIVAMLDQKAGLASELRVTTPDEVKGTTLVILSGHDTQLGALGGILSAHWNPEGGIVGDDMPPGSALVFDLLKPAAPGADYTVLLSFASMTRKQFHSEETIPGGITLSRVTLTGVLDSGCFASECAVPLPMLDGRAVWLQQQKLVDGAWAPAKNDLGPSSELGDPSWTDCHARRSQ